MFKDNFPKNISLLLILINIAFPLSAIEKDPNCKMTNEHVEKNCIKKYKENDKISECIEKENIRIKDYNQKLEDRVLELRSAIDKEMNKIKGRNYSTKILCYFERFRYDYKGDSVHYYLENIFQKDINSIECPNPLNNIYEFLIERNYSIGLYHLAKYLLQIEVPLISLTDLKKLKKVNIYTDGSLIDTTDGEIFLAFNHSIPLMKGTSDYNAFKDKIDNNNLLRFFTFIHENRDVDERKDKLVNGDDKILKNTTDRFLSLEESEIEILFNWKDFYSQYIERINTGIFRFYNKFEKSYELESKKGGETEYKSLSKYRNVLSKDKMVKLIKVYKKHDKTKPDYYKYLERLNDPEKEFLRQKAFKKKKDNPPPLKN